MDREKILKDIDRALYYGELSVTMDELEKHRCALAKLFMPGLNTHGIPAFRGLKEAYHAFGGDESVSGHFHPHLASAGLRACMDFSSSSFAYALQNALNMYLSKAYRDFPFHEEVLISQKENVKDFRTIRSISLDYFQDLPTMNSDTGDFQGIADIQDTEFEYNIIEKGVIVWVTRKVILGDYIGIVKNIIKRVAKAARRTHARYVWDFFINNATCPDGTAWFTSLHGNLGTNTLSIPAAATAIRALADMTEPGSGERLGLDLGSSKWSLVVSITNWEMAVAVNQNDAYFSSNDLTTKTANPCKHLFGKDNERIVINPFMKDSNDWGIIRDKEDVPVVEMSYLMGKEEPELIVADSVSGGGPTPERCFTGRQMGFTLGHDYGGTVGDYRGGYKSTP